MPSRSGMALPELHVYTLRIMVTEPIISFCNKSQAVFRRRHLRHQ